MQVKKGQWPILIVNVISIIVFSFVFFARKNYEFAIYIGVIIFFLWLILYTNKKVNYPNYVLWGLTTWSILHMAGGGLKIGEGVLYGAMLWPLIGEPYNILKYDQFVHAIGFAVATLAMFHVLKPSLKGNFGWKSVSLVVVMAGLGLGALNEIVEFIATIIVPSTGVGGYENTALDLVSNLIGAILAMIYIYFKENRKS